MASATTRTERSAAVQDQIETHLTQSDLESIKQIAETDKDYFPKDFIALCLNEFHYNYKREDDDGQEARRLLLDAFTWFVEEFGPSSPGYYGLGKSKEEVFDQHDKDEIEVLGENLRDILGGSASVFQNHSLVVVKSLIESFRDEDCTSEAMRVYLVHCYEYNNDPHITPERWSKFKMLVELLRNQAVTDEDEDKEKDDWTIVDEGKVLIGHAILSLCRDYTILKHEVTQCLLFVKAHQPNVFLVKNNQGRTVLDIVIRDHGRFRYDQHKIARYDLNGIVRLIVQENPDACLQRGRDRRLPIHLALRLKDQDLFDLIFNAATSVTNQKCPKTYLYPYQLAAVQYTDSNTPDDEASDDEASDDEARDWSDDEDYDVSDEEDDDNSDEEDSDEEDSDVAKLPGPNLLLSRIYELLRQSPNLVGDSISPDCRMLSQPESIAIARDELELARLRDRHFQIEREQAAKIHERKRKHRSSSQAT